MRNGISTAVRSFAANMRKPASLVVLAAPFLLLSGLQPAFAGLNDGLLVYFPFDSWEGATVTNRSGGDDGSVVGTPAFVPDGVVGGAYQFTSRGGSECCSSYRDYIYLDENPTGNLPQFSVSLWLNYDRAANYKVASAADWPRGSGWVLGVQYDEAWIDSPAGYALHGGVIRSSAFAPGMWYHDVMTYDGTVYREYVNGALAVDQVSDHPGARVGSGGRLEIGAWSQHGFGYGGLIDEFRVYGRALTPAEVRVLATAAPIPEPQTSTLMILGVLILLLRATSAITPLSLAEASRSKRMPRRLER